MPASQVAQGVQAPPGFRTTVFAAEPDVVQPIALAFDDRGRLWVAECLTYADAKANFDTNLHDRIVILEDTDHNGQFDRRKVFWDQGQRLTSVELGFGGVWALCAPQLLFIPDRDSDDIPDGPPEVLLDGWNDGPVRHNIVNGLKWGPDGWLYGRHGIQANSSVGKPGVPASERTTLNAAIWRYHPTRRVFEVVCQGGTNPWGHDWDERGELFFINTVIGHLWHGIPGGYFKRMYGEHLAPHRYGLIDQHADHYHWDTGKTWMESREAAGNSDALGGGHAHSGLMVYLGDNWPATYHNGVFTVNYHGRRLNHDRLERSGSGYLARHAPDPVRFPDPWFRGVDLAYGPDGGVFVLDWSDTGECHENDDDGVHRESGRVYKLVYEGPAPRAANPAGPSPSDLAGLTDLELAKLQTRPNDWFARRGRRLLQERAAAGRDLAEAHRELRQQFATQAELPRKLRALWALASSGGADEGWLRNQLFHPEEHVRAWAIRLLMDAGPPVPPVQETFAVLARSDRSALVRLYLAAALQRLPVPQREPLAVALLAHSEDAGDHNLPFMLWYGIEPLAAADPAAALRLAALSRLPLVRQFLARRLAEDFDAATAPVNALLTLASRAPFEFRLDVVRGLSEALRGWRKAPKPEAWERFQAGLPADGAPELRQLARELSVVFGDGRALEELRRVALDSKADPEARRAALAPVVEARPPDLLDLLTRLVDDRVTVGVAARALGRVDDPAVPPLLLKHFDQLNDEDQAAAVGVLASRASYAKALLEALARGRIPRRALGAFHARQIANFGDAALTRQLATLWGKIESGSEKKRLLIARSKQELTPDRLAAADLGQGRLRFNQTCALCHRLYGEGASVGPDLTGSGRASLDYLLENIVDPNAVVPADYHMAIVELKDDRVLTGLIAARTPRTITVQTPTERLTVELAEVQELRDSTVSLMPEGLLEGLSEAQVRDLLAYLMSPRQVPLPAPPIGAGDGRAAPR